ncbi:MAG: helicase [Thermosipho sp. (in: Bacteria)]|nr:helicase [Thermosipho sp. (in: thermotogales)]
MMVRSFITNSHETLAETLKKISNSISTCYFLVGYFYFSGFSEIYEEYKDKDIKILVGLDIEKGLDDLYKEVYSIFQQNEKSKYAVRENFFDDLRNFISNTSFYDFSKEQEAFNVFVDKIKNGTLEIRKTKKATHSKIYIFERKDDEGGVNPGYVIIGSSNLSFKGLSSQNEINVILREPHHYYEAKKIFEQLWNDSVEIVSKNTFNEFEEKVIKKTFLGVVPSPELIYIRALYEYFNVRNLEKEYLPSMITNNKFYDLKYQIDAIEKAISILKQHNGVIIADVVGLGKTVVASAVAHVLRYKTIIIAPPHLVNSWKIYKENFDFQGEVFSSGKLERVLDYIENTNSKEFLIIVDEAHRFRNRETKQYAMLHRICSGNKVMLLSATPFNNRPLEIYNLVTLFQNPARPTFVDSKGINLYDIFKKLDDKFIEAKKSENIKKIKEISEDIRNIINPLIIRRTRLDLERIEVYKEDIKAQGIVFPKINDPVSLEYELGELKNIYLDTLEMICPLDETDKKEYFKAARYRATHYLKDFNKYRKELEEKFGTQNFEILHENLAQFMRKLLVRRFESSLAAFKKSLENMINYTEIMIKWYKSGKVPLYKKGNIIDPDLILNEGDDIDKEILDVEKIEELKNKGYYFIDSQEIKKAFIEDMESDLKVLRKIYRMWFEKDKLFEIEDKKLISFKKHLRDLYRKNPGRKIVVFSEFIDTVEYLYENLKNEFKVMKYTSKDANDLSRKRIIHEFDASSQIQTNEVQLLIATDALSEGFNLNRADVLINYDIPYNPTRVIQRVGRINRIGREVQNEIFIYNYFPSDVGEDETAVKKISTAKIHMFNFILGTDMKTLTSEEELNSYFAQKLKENEEISWDVEYLNDLHYYQNYKKELYNKAINLPKRIRTKVLHTNENGALIFSREKTVLSFLWVDSETSSVVSPDEGFRILKLVKNNNFEKVDEELDKYLKKFNEKKFYAGESIAPRTKEYRLLIMLKKLLEESAIPDEREYLNLFSILLKTRVLPRFFINQAIEILNPQNGEEFEEKIRRLKALIPVDYLERFYLNDKDKIFSREIIMIEQFSKS